MGQWRPRRRIVSRRQSLVYTARRGRKDCGRGAGTGAEATPNPSTVHIVAKMRTLPHDNFSLIGAEYEFVPVEIWKQFGVKPKWRVEKPGRVAVMDGISTMMLIRPDYVVKFPGASQAAFDTGWLLALTRSPGHDYARTPSAQARGWDLKLNHETTGAGVKKLIVTVEAKSGLPADDYLKNKFFEDSDMRRVYRFDARPSGSKGSTPISTDPVATC